MSTGVIAVNFEHVITAFEMWCYRRILKISWTNMITNEEVLRRVGETEAKLLKMIIKRKMHSLDI